MDSFGEGGLAVVDAPATISARDVTLDALARVFEQHHADPVRRSPDGLTVRWDVADCWVELSELSADDEDEWRFLSFVVMEPVRAGADRAAVRRLVNRVNKSVRAGRAVFEGDYVVFDYTAVLAGGPMPSRWAVVCLATLDVVVRRTREEWDRDGVLAWAG
jgi:hypothetical protein